MELELLRRRIFIAKAKRVDTRQRARAPGLKVIRQPHRQPAAGATTGVNGSEMIRSRRAALVAVSRRGGAFARARSTRDSETGNDNAVDDPAEFV